MTSSHRAVALATCLVLAACYPEAEKAPPASPPADAGRGPAGPSAAAARSTPGLLPVPLEEGDTSLLGGELGCAFAREAHGTPLFAATGLVQGREPPQGVIRTGGKPVQLAFDEPGYDAMVDGGRFSAADAEVTVELLATEPLPEDPPVAGESPLYPALLTVELGEETAEIRRFWQCGP